MQTVQFDAMVQRLEHESAQAPRSHLVKVALLAALGFAILALLVGLAASGLLLLVGIALAMIMKGGTMWLWLIKLGKLALLLAIPLWLLVKSSVQALFVRIPPPQGREVQRHEAPALFAALDDMRRRLRGPRFHHVLIDGDMNAAVVQRPAFGLFGLPRNYLILGLPLLEGLQPEEALAVVAHEYGHLAGAHGRFAGYIYRLRNSWGTIQQMAEAWRGWAGRALARLVAWYAPYFNAYTFVLARANEYEADAAAADLVGPQAAARALKRFHIANGQHDGFLATTFEAMRVQPSPPRDLAQQWAARATQAPQREQALHWLQQALDRTPKAMDTHPTLRRRLLALLPDDAAADEAPEALRGASAADAWFGALAGRLREEQQQQWAERVAQPWQEQHAQWQQRRARLDELAALPTPDAEQRLELLRLRADFNPAQDHSAAFAAFNADHPDHPVGLYLEGSQRLAHGDDAGLALLDRAMALDADAIKPGCERAFTFLSERNDPCAEAYRERWLQRDAWARERQQQIDTLQPGDTLVDAALDADTLAQVHAHLKPHGSSIRHAWIARRVIAADPDERCYVLGVQVSQWTRMRGKEKALIQALAKQPWPLALHVCLLSDRYKPLLKQFKALPGAQLR
ncbi:MAG TPA: M48 family metallopeptidase [Burkholderiaceae bacterium]|nr:M48 family metallopeptidase [Burkholderiaceae bacterium]